MLNQSVASDVTFGRACTGERSALGPASGTPRPRRTGSRQSDWRARGYETVFLPCPSPKSVGLPGHPSLMMMSEFGQTRRGTVSHAGVVSPTTFSSDAVIGVTAAAVWSGFAVFLDLAGAPSNSDMARSGSWRSRHRGVQGSWAPRQHKQEASAWAPACCLLRFVRHLCWRWPQPLCRRSIPTGRCSWASAYPHRLLLPTGMAPPILLVRSHTCASSSRCFVCACLASRHLQW